MFFNDLTDYIPTIWLAKIKKHVDYSFTFERLQPVSKEEYMKRGADVLRPEYTRFLCRSNYDYKDINLSKGTTFYFDLSTKSFATNINNWRKDTGFVFESEDKVSMLLRRNNRETMEFSNVKVYRKQSSGGYKLYDASVIDDDLESD